MSIALAISSILVLGLVRSSAEEAKLAKAQVVKTKLKMAGDAVSACLSFISSSSATYTAPKDQTPMGYCAALSSNITNKTAISLVSANGTSKTFTYALQIGPGFNAANYSVTLSAINGNGGTLPEGYQAYVVDTSTSSSPDILNKYPLANIGYILGSKAVLNGQYFDINNITAPSIDKAYPLYYVLQAIS